MERIGYCERIAESAEQYAQRLLEGKAGLKDQPAVIAKEMVHTYKDHNFVVDLAEARAHLGEDWVKEGTPEVAAAEDLCVLFDQVNLWAGWLQSTRLLVLGELAEGLRRPRVNAQSGKRRTP